MLLYNPDRISKIDKVASPTDGGIATLTADGSFVDTGVLFSDIPLLSNGKLDPLVLPPLGIAEVFVVADITARDALTVQSGDIAKVIDSDGAGHPQTYIYDGSTWIDIQETSDVISVNGKTKTVVLATDDIAEGSINLYYTEPRVSANSSVISNTAALKFFKVNGTARNSAMANGTGSVAIGENSFVDSSCTKGTAIGWQAYIDANADSGIALGNEALAEEAINPIAIGTAANSSADNAIQLGSGANSTANTLKYRNLFVANQNSLMTLATVTNYAPATANEIDSHLQAIDAKIGTLDTAIAAREIALVVGTEQTANFTAAVGKLEPVNSSNSAITVTPPSAPAVGDKFAVVDSRANSVTNNITVDFAAVSQLLYGVSDTFTFNENGSYAEFKFLGGEIGWIVQK